ncbi:EamA family transporter [Mycolicibacterium sp.]|uniref:EamA family transporter n=1 Tax=Mycolicibacterium sp. TaxID=2320850 RepID=UPI0028A895EB|nr:EamA family transporter [Mycolicibacterium sp.]
MSKTASVDHFRLGLLFATTSAFSFGMSGPLAKALMVAGWSPTAAVTARLAGGALVLAIAATIVKPDWLIQARVHARTVVAYGLIPVAGAQLCYYNAVAHLSVGVALLLEYTSPVLVIGWLWITTKRRPAGRTLAGVALAIIGIALVLDVVNGARVDAVGVAWGLGAALCAVCYFMMSDAVTADGSGLHAITLAAGSLVVATVAVTALGLAGVMPLRFTADDTVIAGMTLPWFVPVLLLGVVATALAYQLGISGVARLRPGFASLVGLAEVMFAVVAAWLLLDERITVVQAVGGIVVLAGLTLARPGERGSDVHVSLPQESMERITVSLSAERLEQS